MSNLLSGNTAKTYLGDGLYCDFDGYQYRLYTMRENGTHEVFLESEVLKAFIRFTKQIKQELKEEDL